jgi:hypothetical protein
MSYLVIGIAYGVLLAGATFGIWWLVDAGIKWYDKRKR